MQPFSYTALPGKVIFGSGALAQVADEIRALGCSRALLLSRGTMLEDGPASDVVGRYLNAGRVAGRGEVVWNDHATAPGSDSFRFAAVRVRNARGEVGDTFDRLSTIRAEIDFRKLGAHGKVGATIVLHNEEGVCVFSSLSNREPGWREALQPAGSYRATCEIPEGLLAEGRYRLSASLWRDHYQSLERIADAVQFSVHESPGERDDYFGEWHGVVRPALAWRTRPLDEGPHEDERGAGNFPSSP